MIRQDLLVRWWSLIDGCGGRYTQSDDLGPSAPSSKRLMVTDSVTIETG